MLLKIIHNPSGEILHQRRLRDDETLDPEILTDQWLEATYAGELVRVPSAGYAEYRTEVGDWDALDWFGSVR